MGTYQYTLRADTKTVDGLEIGHYQFAYKHGFWGDARYERMADTKSRHAENAQAKLRHVTLFVQGQWDYAEGREGLPIFDLPKAPSEFTEELRHARIHGVLRKEGRTYRIDPPEDWMLARNAALDAEAA